MFPGTLLRRAGRLLVDRSGILSFRTHCFRTHFVISLLLAALTTPGPGLSDSAWAQPPGVVVPAGGKVQATSSAGGAPGNPAAGKPATGAQGDKPAEEKKDDQKDPAASAGAVQRPQEPPVKADSAELKVKPNPDGRIRLNFHGQKWLDVLQWYAGIAGLSLDWQEIPGDYLNLVTQREYSVTEVRDVLNRHLLDRGYTLLRSGEVLVVANLKKLDPSLVPRVFPEDLDNLQPHEFARTSFKLDWLIADTTVEELKPLLSPNGKLWAMKATNRVEAIDAVTNLLAIRHVLSDEQSGHGQERLVREFKLQHSRAGDVYDLLLGLLGKEKPKKDEGPMDPRRMMQMQQQMMQMQQMQQQGKPAGGDKKPGEIHLVVNQRENSILVNGPPDQVAIVEQAVKQLDVPGDSQQSLLQNPNRMQIYRLTAIDPEPLVATLNEVGNLDPTTQLRVDKKNRSIIAYASLVDHVIIKAMVDKLDGTDRRFEVIRLRKLEADYVAGSIQFMMGEPEDKQQSSRRSWSYFDPFGSSGGETEQKETRKFRVDADVEHNRLLIWANDVELAEIQNLLVKLGELPPPGSRAATLRTLDSIPLEDAPYLLERLREAWPAQGENPLQLKIQPRATPAVPEDASPRSPLELRSGDRNTSTRIEPPVSGTRASVASQPTLFRFSSSSVSRTAAREQADGQQAGTAIARPRMSLLAQAEPEAARVESVRDKSGADDAASEKPDRDEALPEALRQVLPRKSSPPPVTETVEGGSAPQAAPVTVELDANGRWILRSQDTAALDRLEDLLVDLAPPRRDYKLFQLQHSTSWAYGIALNLEDFFKDEDKKEPRRPYWWYDDGSSSAKKDDSRRLSKRRPLKFIADTDSNSILVVGADPHQLRTIEELIEYYDQPVASDAKALRRTEIFPIKHSKAEVIADAIKDVYRDLLSENDKALQRQGGQDQNQQRASERTVTYVYDSFGDGEKKGSDPPTPVRFKGALSIGVDPISNSLIVSSTEMLLENIRRTIESLDQAAVTKTPSLQVMSVNRDVPVELVKERLAKLLKEQKPQQPRQARPQQPNQPQQAQQVDAFGADEP